MITKMEKLMLIRDKLNTFREVYDLYTKDIDIIKMDLVLEEDRFIKGMYDDVLRILEEDEA